MGLNALQALKVYHQSLPTATYGARISCGQRTVRKESYQRSSTGRFKYCPVFTSSFIVYFPEHKRRQNILYDSQPFQIIHKGCAAEDFARYLSLSMSAKDRREHLDELLKYYCGEVERYLGHKPPFTFEQVN